mmetsp:Transcript_62296/g.148724  ORF Transcript_62296/g.148724 Transcript_62296/m.148724 type:complete len:491 (+) Transcript_62296:57-1529(+)
MASLTAQRGIVFRQLVGRRVAVHVLRQQTRTCSSSSSTWDPWSAPRPDRRKTDTTTKLDMQRNERRVERRIGEHLKAANQEEAVESLEAHYAAEQESAKIAADADVSAGSATPAPKDEIGDEALSKATQASDEDAAVAVDGRVPLRVGIPTSVEEGAKDKDLIIRSRTTTGQVLWPATEEDIEILSESKLIYPAPYEVEGSVIIRLVRLSDPVTSPVARVFRNRQFGIRGNEKWQLLAWGVVSASIVYTLGFWQLQRMEWKRDLIEKRQTRLDMPRLVVSGSPFPWKDEVADWEYRIVEVRGVFDHTREIKVGPRPGMNCDGESNAGYNVVTPLRLEDGSSILINRGHVPHDKIDPAARPEVPAWVRVRGVLEAGEMPNMVADYARVKNRPERQQFTYMIPKDMAQNAGARNHEECSQAMLTALDVLFEDDFQAGTRRDLPFTMRHKGDYLLFWADEHTHFNYAMQWFGMGTLFMAMTVYKFIEVWNWRY